MADGRAETRDRLAIIAGGGLLPRYVADAARARGENPYILALSNESSENWSGFDHQVISIGNYAGIGAAFRANGIGRAVLSGFVRRRPEWRDIHAPWKALLAVPSIVRTLMKGGDDTVLKMVIRLIESEGVRVVGAHEIVPDLLGTEGPLGTVVPDTAAEADIAAAAAAALALGRLDVGQGAVAVGGRVVALEGAEGTDAMLERVAQLRVAGRISQRRKGVLVKLCKPEQDLRADLPSIGVETLRRAQAAGLAGLAVEAGRSLVLEREALMAEANACGLFVTGIVPSRTEGAS
ncbi:UDP-2,3-diacylglucosamine diphosphatase LpxI [Shinella sp. CPCC 101442]|uniref:LpxI family protein n=1 Tax=Shinella sp. CPCC 101442 TaxID=2932265 RepID=UPI00215284AB|nr:UDP-2,3-diacylglucosamine diphosphatase LpxI [Shinella sp. CPCC 101442]MCR6501958.1 UDP-2,3-diacylglucosamine diphosphatase LpxI [Shinella sp. CPCC 101442]